MPHSFDPSLSRKLEAGIEAGLLRDLHAVLVGHRGELALERYYSGEDQNWGQPLGNVTFDAATLHDLRSVTKSVVSLLYGIALDRGLVPPVDAPLMAQFPDYPDLAADATKAGLTIEHALTMTMGLEWDEERPYTDPLNSEIAMENAPDRYRFILERPVVAEAGTRWIYSGGSVALIGALIARGTGQSLPDFAREALFTPLGIDEFEWSSGPDGVPSAASGLRLRPRDLLRIGELVLNYGELNGQRVVSREWIEASLAPAIGTGDGLDYGRLWFLGQAPTPALPGEQKWAGGFGNGGQRLWLMPDAGLAAVILAGKYNAWDAWVTPTRIWREIVLANLVEA
ncbi:6-aminohexanoate-dimer hydrolase [Devosia yakushimensis]|uniref:6-aminohexanoate-dimer hydrolase n=1 Tax=Devosia yakushimensis TaxID=470028 RepID=A0ABQ5UE05_9HYPH|nr:serine hydrolase domain-containing protein [Devosia yakushimensis]GLQ09384.1 6-aminohexanoate-dimer hydrolase [Devosia yakushimensis]